ncbi:MAG: DNA-3-methyladenine glycosylase 2 family protein [Thiobacillaceae bacterium]
MREADYWTEACRVLSRRDPVMKRLIKRYPDANLRSRGNAFETLLRAIVGQQISVKAADAVWGRLCAFTPIEVKTVSKLAVDQIRACGLSRRKAEYCLDLAGHFAEGRIRPRRWSNMDDEAIIDELTDVRGIGRWTAEMFLIFHLLRPNVWPVDDLGLLKAISLHYREGEKLTPGQARELGVAWEPWRTVATWYLWRSLDPLPVEY